MSHAGFKIRDGGLGYGRLLDQQLEYILKEIINRDDHGDFLKAFAMAYVRADFENRIILCPAAMDLVVKYGLADHLPKDGNLEGPSLKEATSPTIPPFPV